MAIRQRTFQSISTFFDVSCHPWCLSCYLWRLLLHGLGFHPYSLWHCPGCSQNVGDSRNPDASIVARPIKAHPRLYCLRTPFGAATISLAPLPRFRRHHLQLHPLDLLTRLSRLAAVQCVIYAYFFGEMDYVRQWSSRSNATWQIILLSGNGIIACALNIVSFEANRRSGALTMGVAGHFLLSIPSRRCHILNFALAS
jgi:hypothetical protein